jgi:hypothetical protein
MKAGEHQLSLSGSRRETAMSPETAEFLRDAGNVVLGAVIGFVGAALSESWKDRKKARAMKDAIRRELRETAHRFLGLVYTLSQRHGGFDREMLEWMKPQVERYQGPNPRDGMLAGVTGFLGQTDDQIAAFAEHMKARMAPQFVPHEEPAYTTASIGVIHDLEPDYAARVLDILAHIRMLNDARENGLFHTRLTFTPGLSEGNHDSARQGIDNAEIMMARRARIVIDKITALEDRYPEN